MQSSTPGAPERSGQTHADPLTPVLRPAAMASLARHDTGPAERKQLVSELALFLAQLEDAPCVTAAHVEAAASVAAGGEIGEDAHPADDIAAIAATERLPGFSAEAFPAGAVVPYRPLFPSRTSPLHPRPLPSGRVPMVPAQDVPLRRRSIGIWLIIGAAVIGAAYPVTPLRLGDRPVGPLAPALPVQQSCAAGQFAPVASERSPLPPPGVMLHVVLAYPLGDATAAQESRLVMLRLRAAGYDVDDPVPAQPGMQSPGIRYFFGEDRLGATVLAGRFRDGSMRPELSPPGTELPRPGTVRITMSATGTALR